MDSREFFSSILVIGSLMALAALLERARPMFDPAPGFAPGRRRANLAMNALTVLLQWLLTTGAAAAIASLPLRSPGLLERTSLPAPLQAASGIVVLDFAYGYLAHRLMHSSALLWRFHRVHHADAFVDVTTSFRTHPVENLWRFLFLAMPVFALGIPAAVVVLYRLLSAANGIFEHTNVGVPVRVDSFVSRAWVTPRMHKIHHSREREETDTNYGNLLSLHDRLLGTWTPSERATCVAYGLDDAPPPGRTTVWSLLAMPWSDANEGGIRAATAAGAPTA